MTAISRNHALLGRKQHWFFSRRL